MAHERLLAGRYRVLGRYAADSRRALWQAEDVVSNRSLVVASVSKAKARWYEPSVDVRNEHLATIVAVIRAVEPGVIPLAKDEAMPEALAVAEVAPGRSLGRVIAESGPLPLQQAVTFAARAVTAVGALHQQRATHGAISDRCLVVERTDGGVVPVLTQVVETPRAVFASPERLHGAGTSRFDDVWSLHVLLYVLLTGRLPYRGTEAKSVLEAIRVHLPDKLASEGISDERLQRILDRGLRYAPEERTDSVFELEGALLQWLSLHGSAQQDVAPSSDASAVTVSEVVAPDVIAVPSSLPEPPTIPDPVTVSPVSGQPASSAILGALDMLPPDTSGSSGTSEASVIECVLDMASESEERPDTDHVPGADENTIRMDAPGPHAPLFLSVAPGAPVADANAPGESGSLPVLPHLPPPAPVPKKRRLASFLVGILGGAIVVGGAITIGTVVYMRGGQGQAQPVGSVPRGGGSNTDSTARNVVKIMFPPPLSARPGESNASAPSSSVPSPKSSTSLPTVAETTRCVAALFPVGTFDPSQDLSFVCTQADPRKGSNTMRSRVVTGSRGYVTAGMQEWARLEWHEMPVWSILRESCCANPAPLSMPNPVRDCASVGKAADAVGRAYVTRESVEGPLAAFQKAAECAYLARDPAFTYPSGPISGGQVTFAQFLERNTKRREGPR